MEKRIPVKVSIHPSEYAGRSIRLGDPQSDIRDKMQQRMREFEDESRKWREQFLSNSGLGGGVGGVSSMDHRPRMMVTFPEFPELSTNWLGRSGSSSFFPPPAIPTSQTAIASSSSTASSSHKSFIEEDNDGSKKYKLQVEVGEFRPNELQVKTEGRLLVIKGDHELVSGSATESKQFNREITLPDFIEPTTVVSYLTDGILTIEAPVIMERFGITNANNQASSSSINTSSSVNSIGFGNNFPTISRSPFREASPQRTIVATTNVKNNVSNINREEFQNAERELQNKFSNQQLFTDGLTSVGTISAPVGTIANSVASYKFNMSEFKPEDISITVTDTTLKVHAIREETDVKGVGKTYREFKREIGLPQGSDVKRLKNSLNPDGFLFIEIPVNDNSTLQPPQSPTIHKQFNNLSLSAAADNNAGGLVNRKSEISTFSSADSSLLNERVNVGDKELKITFDLNGYKPEDVNIKVTDNTLKVHAVHIDNSKGNQIHREYSRSYILPEWVNPELLRARMSDNGTLTVEVPLPQVQPSKLERLIKIQKL